jgi:hypothetical protein
MGSLCNSALAVPCLQKSEIDKQAVRIEAKITRERRIVYCLTTLGIVHELYQWVPLLSGFFGQPSVEAPKKEDSSMFQAFKNGLRSLFYTKEGWVSMAQCGLSVGGFVIISKVSEQFIHPDTLYWYIGAYAPYMRTIKIMQERLSLLQEGSFEQGNITTHKEFLRVLYDRLVHQSELICGYMVYKVKHLDNEEKAIGQRAVKTMINSQNDWLKRISLLLDADKQNYEKIQKRLAAYGVDITSQLNHFSVVEGETVYDRSVVRRNVKAAATA